MTSKGINMLEMSKEEYDLIKKATYLTQGYIQALSVNNVPIGNSISDTDKENIINVCEERLKNYNTKLKKFGIRLYFTFDEDGYPKVVKCNL